MAGMMHGGTRLGIVVCGGVCPGKLGQTWLCDFCLLFLGSENMVNGYHIVGKFGGS